MMGNDKCILFSNYVHIYRNSEISKKYIKLKMYWSLLLVLVNTKGFLDRKTYFYYALYLEWNHSGIKIFYTSHISLCN